MRTILLACVMLASCASELTSAQQYYKEVTRKCQAGDKAACTSMPWAQQALHQAYVDDARERQMHPRQDIDPALAAAILLNRPAPAPIPPAPMPMYVPPPVPVPHTFNCTTNFVGNFANTNCY